jgi:2Fe-2S ferredoxin
MISITFVSHLGTSRQVWVQPGMSLMQAAKLNDVDGILALCGGACACATCHVYISPEWVDVVGAPGDMERLIIEFAQEQGEHSRLSCQIQLTDSLNGLVVRLPAEQG